MTSDLNLLKCFLILSSDELSNKQKTKLFEEVLTKSKKEG